MPRIFISYSSKDVRYAQILERQLNDKGFTVWRDKTRLETDWSREIAFALVESDILCLIWSQHAALSKWVKHEWLTARALEKRIIPLFLPAHPDLPDALSSIDGIKAGRDSTVPRKLFEKLQQPVIRAKYEYTILPPHSFIPFNPNPEFVGREADLVELYLAAIGNLKKIGINHVSTTGLGGVGKTQLAIEFAYRFSFAFHAVFWMDATNPERWREQFISLARDRLGLDIPDRETATAGLQWLLALQSHFKRNRDALLVLDNVTDPKNLNSDRFVAADLTPLSFGASVLFTTRRSLELPGVVSYPLGMLSPDAAYQLLTARRTPDSSQEMDSAHQITRAVGYLALAIVLIAGYQNKFRSVTFREYHEALSKQKLDSIDLSGMTKEELATRHEAAIGVTLETQWQAVQSEPARQLFKLAALFPEAAFIPKVRLGLFAGIPAGRSPLERPLDSAFLTLEELNLVEAAGAKKEYVQLHPLVRAFSEAQVTAEEHEVMKRAAAQSMAAAYADPLRMEAEWRSRGLDEVIGDLEAAIEFGADAGQTGLLIRLLNRERHHLREDEQKVTFFQQLHHRAQMMSANAWAEEYAKVLAARGVARLRTISVQPAEDSALVQELRGHSNQLRGVAFLDDNRAVTTSWDSNLILWNVKDAEPLRVNRGHKATIEAFAVTPDGRFCLTASDDSTLILWNLKTGEEIRRLEGHKDYVLSAAISPDARWAASMSRDSAIIFWDLPSGIIKAKSGQWEIARCWLDPGLLAMRPDGDLILTVPLETERRNELISIDSRSQLVRRLAGHQRAVTAVSFSREGALALTGDTGGRLILWEVATFSRLKTTQVDDAIHCIAFSPDEQHAVVGSGRDLIYLDLSTGLARRTFRGHSEVVQYAAISPNGRLIISAGRYEKTAKVWEIDSPSIDEEPVYHKAAVKAISFGADGRAYASLDENQSLVLWRGLKGRYVRQSRSAPTVVNASIDWTGRRQLSSVGSKLELSDLETGHVLRTIDLPGDVHCSTLSPGGHRGYFTLGGRGLRQIMAFDCESGGREVAVQFAVPVHHLSVTADGSSLLIGSDYGSMIVWDLLANREIARHEGARESIRAMCIESSGRYAVTCSWSNLLTIWDLKNGAALRSLSAAERPTAVAMFGSNIVFGDDSGRLYYLRLETGSA